MIREVGAIRAIVISRIVITIASFSGLYFNWGSNARSAARKNQLLQTYYWAALTVVRRWRRAAIRLAKAKAASFAT